MTFEEVRLDLDTINCSISIHLHNCITIESVCLHEKKLTNWLSPQVHGYREKHLLRPCHKFLNPSESQFIQCHAYDIQFYNVLYSVQIRQSLFELLALTCSISRIWAIWPMPWVTNRSGKTLLFPGKSSTGGFSKPEFSGGYFVDRKKLLMKEMTSWHCVMASKPLHV